jgi:hypothetical protein
LDIPFFNNQKFELLVITILRAEVDLPSESIHALARCPAGGGPNEAAHSLPPSANNFSGFRFVNSGTGSTLF